MKIIKNYENAETKGVGDFVPLKLGGHICVIKRAYEALTNTEKNQLILELDIAEGEQKNYFQKQYETDTRANKKWGCVYRQLSEPENVEYFKGLITSIERSNPGYIWDWDEKKLEGKLIGGIFGIEEYTNQHGELKTITKCVQARSIDKVLDAQIPKVKTINGEKIDYELYISQNSNKTESENEVCKNERGGMVL